MEHETRRLELEMRERHRELRSKDFDLAKPVRLIPKFSEDEIDQYFQNFEKTVSNLKCPRHTWMMLLQTVEWKSTKSLLYANSRWMWGLKVWKRKFSTLTSWCQKRIGKSFETTRKLKQNHLRNSSNKETYFDRWSSSEAVGDNHEKLRQLILMEDFKNNLSGQLRLYLEERRVGTARELAVLADEYVLTRETSKARHSQRELLSRQKGNHIKSKVSVEDTKGRNSPQISGKKDPSHMF